MIDVSTLGEFAFCKRAIFLEKPSLELHIHNVLRKTFQGIFSSKDTTELTEIYKKEFRSALKDSGRDFPTEDIKRIEKSLISESRNLTHTKVYKPSVKVNSDRLQLRGMIDLLEPEENIPIMISTGNMPRKGVWEPQKLKLGAYMMLLGEDSKKGMVWYVKNSQKRVVRTNKFLNFKIQKTIQEIKELEKMGKIPTRIQKNRCSTCIYMEQCWK